jgi:hypothetical protein
VCLVQQDCESQAAQPKELSPIFGVPASDVTNTGDLIAETGQEEEAHRPKGKDQ